MDWLLSEPGLALVGTVVGNYFRQKAEALQIEREWKLSAIKAADASADAAAARSGSGGTWTRRGIYFLIAFFMVSIVVAGFTGVPVVVETTVTKGMLFWRHVVTEFVTIDGVLFPPEIRKAFLLFIGFYLGQGVK